MTTPYDTYQEAEASMLQYWGGCSRVGYVWVQKTIAFRRWRWVPPVGVHGGYSPPGWHGSDVEMDADAMQTD